MDGHYFLTLYYVSFIAPLLFSLSSYQLNWKLQDVSADEAKKAEIIT